MRRRWRLASVFVLAAACWAGTPWMYRASWSVIGEPPPVSVQKPVLADLPVPEVFQIDATRAPPNEGARPPWASAATGFLEIPSDCRLPPASSAAAIVVFGVTEGRQGSPVALGDVEVVTEVVEVVVESGTAPIYLLLSAGGPTIWRFRGATGRLERVVLAASPLPRDNFEARGAFETNSIPQHPPARSPYAGVVGLSADQVTAVDQPNCLEVGSDPEGRKALRVATVVWQALGRQPSVLAATYTASAISVPSGRAAVRDQMPYPAPISSDTYWPDGIADIAADQVVSSVPVRPYNVFPGRAGWSQLIKTGAVIEGSEQTWIRASIERFPPGLAWGPPIVVGAFVPMPSGPTGVRCVRRQLLPLLRFSVAVRGPCAGTGRRRDRGEGLFSQ